MKTQLSIKILFFILVTFAALFEALWDVILKKWTLDGKHIYFLFGVLVYLVAIILWAFSLKHEFLSKAISIVTVINLIIVVLIWVFYFKEDLSTLNKIWILFGVISLILIEI
jgi:multidrug transporter EmrE-like cation transporter